MTKGWRYRISDVRMNMLTNTFLDAYLPLLVNDGNSIIEFHIVEETGQEDVCDANQTVVFLLVKERVCPTEI